MSLLNAALRKKKKENQHAKTPAIFSDTGKTPGKSRRLWFYGMLACLALALGLAVPFGLGLFPPEKMRLPMPQLNYSKAVKQDKEPARISPVADVLPAEPPKTAGVKTDTPEKTVPQPPGQAGEPAIPEKSVLKPEKSVEKTVVKKPEKTTRAKSSPMSASQAPASPIPAKQDFVSPFYEKAVRYHQQNRLREAIVMYRQVLNKNPGDTEALFNIAAAYLENREFAMALSILQDLSEKDPNNPQVLLNLAIARMGMGEPDTAISLLDKAQRISGLSAFDLYFHKAAALSQLGRLDEAERLYEKAGKIDPDNSRLLFNVAVLYDKMERYDDALQYYRTFLAKRGWSSDKEKKSVEDRVLFLTGFIERQQYRIQERNRSTSTGDNIK